MKTPLLYLGSALVFSAVGVVYVTRLAGPDDDRGKATEVKTRTTVPLKRESVSPEPEKSDEKNSPVEELTWIKRDGSPASMKFFEVELPKRMDENPAAIAASAIAANLGSDRSLILNRVAYLWGARQPDAAVAWANTIQAPIERSSLIRSISRGFANVNPRAALELAERTLQDDKSDAILDIVYDWAEREISGATYWVLSRPTDDLRSSLVQRLAIKRAELDPGQAARLVLDEIPAGDIRNEALVAVVHQWALRDKAKARAWVEQFPSTNPVKERALREVMNVDSL